MFGEPFPNTPFKGARSRSLETRWRNEIDETKGNELRTNSIEPHNCSPLIMCVLFALFLGGCSGCQPEPAPPQAVPPSVPTQSADNARAVTVVVNIQTVDLEGRPVAGMMPIATRQPNAFDRPIAHGAPTGADGSGRVEVPSEEHLYVRAWDPDVKAFANNYYDILPGDKMDPAPLKITMVPGTRLTAQLIIADAKLVKDATVNLRMSHPTEGPWWPAQAKSTPEGNVQFPFVPAGKFNLEIEVSGAKVNVDGVMLLPGGEKDLGVLKLQ